MEPLLKLLDSWLNMSRPFDVYLKALQYILGHKEEIQRLFAPVLFQQILIQAAMRQLKKYGGGFIVAATGLGKTIIGSEIALQFQESSRRPKTIILVAPPLVHKKWKTQFIHRRLTANIFSITVPFSESGTNPNHQINQLGILLNLADENTLILIDEAHYYRNQQAYERTRNAASRVYQLFEPAVQRGARVVLLTATVYGTTLDNLNGLLRFLPHHPIHNELHIISDRWKVKNVSEFIGLDIVSVLSISHVLTIARLRGHVEDGQPYIQYPDKRVYLPRQLILKRISYDLPNESEIQTAFDKNIFNQRENFHIPYLDDETGDLKKTPVNFLYKVALDSWLSSPKAMAETIQRNLATPDLHSSKQPSLFSEDVLLDKDEESYITTPSGAYKLALQIPLDIRRRTLNPVLESITAQELCDDKLNKLIEIIEKHHMQEKSKILIFIRRHATALYLIQKLTTYYGETVKVGSTVEAVKAIAKLKSREKRDDILCQFCPSSFPEVKPLGVIDVLICTDADGLGIDLPEADIIVNYDIPEGADVLFQRAGRVLRMTTRKERQVVFYTFIPELFNKEMSDSSCHRAIYGKFNRLIKRHRNASNVLNSNVLSDQPEHSILLNDAVIDNIEDFMKQADLAENLFSSMKNSLFEHEVVLLKHQETCKTLPGFVHSAQYHNKSTYLIFLLIHWKEKLYPVLFNASSKTIEHQSESEILNRIACQPDTEKAFIPVWVVEKLCQQALEAWCADDLNEPRILNETRKWCAMVLLPKSTSQQADMREFAQLVDADQVTKKKKRTIQRKVDTLQNLFEEI